MATNIKKYKKKDGSTAYQFKKYLGIDPVTGKQKETTRRGFSTLKEAKLALSRLEFEIAEGVYKEVKKKSLSYREVTEEWFELIYKNRVKESTYWNTRLVFDKHILPVFGALQLDKIDVSFCQRQANKWAKSSPNRYKRSINYAGMIFKYGVVIGAIKENPMSKVIIPVSSDKENDGLENFFERDELQYFLSYFEKKSEYKRYAFFFLASYTGLRKGELLALTWRDIDFKNSTLTINKTLATGKNGKKLIQTPKTKTSNRTISIDPDALHVLKNWRPTQRENLKLLDYIPSVHQLVFSDIENELLAPRTPQNWLDVFYNHNKAFKRITIHGLRHTHASLLFEAGASMKQVQSRLGHSNIKTTMNVYTHVTKDSKEQTASLFSNFMNNNSNLGQSLGQNKKTH